MLATIVALDLSSMPPAAKGGGRPRSASPAKGKPSGGSSTAGKPKKKATKKKKADGKEVEEEDEDERLASEGDTDAAWRLVDKQAKADVYRGTRTQAHRAET